MKQSRSSRQCHCEGQHIVSQQNGTCEATLRPSGGETRSARHSPPPRFEESLGVLVREVNRHRAGRNKFQFLKETKMSLSKLLLGVFFGLSLAVTGCGGGVVPLDNPKDAASRPNEEQLKKMHEEEARKEAAQSQKNR